MAIALFDDSEPSAGDPDLSKIEINQEYSKRLEHNKRREALQRYEEYRKRGLAGDSGDSNESSDESSSDEAARPSAKEDLQFFDAIARIKKKDPILLRKDTKLFSSSSSGEEEDEAEEKKKPKTARKEKPVYLKDVMAKQLIEDGPEFEEEPLRKNPKVYSREQAEGIKAFLEAEKEAFGSGYDDDDDDIIKLKESSGTEDDGYVGEIHKKADEIFEEDENDMFLKIFLLNKGWVDKEKNERPSFDDIGVSEDEDELEKQDKYEAEYNFRHEEEQEDRVVGHSRITEGSVRKKSSSRKAQRKSKEERMVQAKFERKEELKHLKNLKKKEIQEKLERIRVSAGIGDDGVCNLDAAHLEEDFDPEEYDKTMKVMFGVDYYNADDADPSFGSDAGDDIEKPDFDKEDKFGLPKDWYSVDAKEGFGALRKIILEKNEELEEPTQVEGKKKRNRKISLRQKVELDKELEEYYKLDYEGTVGDLKTRFKYRSVPANSYGLHTEEILMVNDKDLNQYVSLKRLAPFREKEWKVTYHQKLKKSLILHGVKSDSKISGRKHETVGIVNITDADKKAEFKEANGDASVLSKRSRKRRKHAQLKLSKSRLIAYGMIPSKRHKKQ